MYNYVIHNRQFNAKRKKQISEFWELARKYRKLKKAVLSEKEMLKAEKELGLVDPSKRKKKKAKRMRVRWLHSHSLFISPSLSLSRSIIVIQLCYVVAYDKYPELILPSSAIFICCLNSEAEAASCRGSTCREKHLWRWVPSSWFRSTQRTWGGNCIGLDWTSSLCVSLAVFCFHEFRNCAVDLSHSSLK